jgi:hypothetical protein
VADREFQFEVRVANRLRLDDLLMDLAARFLGRLGYASADVADVVASMGAELNREGPGAVDECVVRFSAGEGQFRILMSLAGGREWRSARPLP